MTSDFVVLSRILASARRVVVLTGAGLSADSGIPTYRGVGSENWSGLGASTQREMVKKDLAGLWHWYDSRRRLAAACEPNPGHFAIAEMARHIPQLTLVTQNIDGLHQRAGSEDVLEVHGSLWQARGVRCSHKQALPPGAIEIPPRCALCGHPLRPDIVFFGERLSQRLFKRATEAARRCDVMMLLGTSGEVAPVSTLPELAKASGARLIEVNPAATAVSALADETFRVSTSLLRWSE